MAPSPAFRLASVGEPTDTYRERVRDRLVRSARSNLGPDPLDLLVAPTWDTLGRPGHHNLTTEKVFVEVFAGKAHLTWRVAQHNVPVLPFVDITPWPPLVASTDALDPAFETTLNQWIDAGRVGWIHFGTECRTYSKARKENDGGPRPVRDDRGIILDRVTVPNAGIASWPTR